MRTPARILLLAGALALAGAGCAAAPRAVETRIRPCPTAVTPKERPDDGVDVITRCTYYKVPGETAPELRTFMSTWGPRDETGTYDAYTAFALHYGYQRAERADGCSMTQPTVELYLMHILPEWSPLPGGARDPGLLERWTHYTTRLSAHEAGHADISVRAANELYRGFAELPPSPTCDALRATAHDLFDAAVRRLKAEHRRYDMRTMHGATQGSLFP